MACVHAVFKQHQQTDGGRFFICPSSYPSWTSPHRNYVSTAETSSGFVTTWTTHNVVCLSVTDSHRPSASCIAHFPALAQSQVPSSSSSPTASSPSQPTRTASLVTSTYRFVTIASPGDVEAVRTPIGDPLSDPMTAIGMFTPPSGLILCTANVEPTAYHFLAHPLQESTPLSLPPDHVLLNAFIDVPLLVTRAQNTLTVWSCIQEDAPMPEFPQLAVPSSSMDISSKSLLSVPTLKLTNLYNLSVNPSKTISAFLSHDVHGLLALCIVADGVLIGLSIIQQDSTTYKISPSFRIRDVTSAVPVLAVRRHHVCLDALVRHADGNFSLFMGRSRLCDVKVPVALDSNLDLNDTQLMLTQSVADEFSLVNMAGDGQRFSLESAYFLSPLVNKCLAAITYSFEETSAVTRITALYHDLLSARASIHQSPAKLRSIKTDRNIEWSLLESVLLRVISPTSSSLEDPNDMEIDSFDDELPNFDDDLTDEGSDSDWQALLRSEIHEEFTATKEYSVSPPRTHAYPSVDDTLSACIPESGFPHTDIMKQVLNALHLLYEDFKLRSLCGIECRHLARLNHRLACLLGNFAYIDHYRRDFPELVEGQKVDSIPTIPSSGDLGVNMVVPSISTCLAAKINGDSSKKSSYPARKANGRLECHQDPMLTASWRKESPFELTQRIINYYNILFGRDGEEGLNDKEGDKSNLLSMSSKDDMKHSSIAMRYERVLLAMVADNVTTADIDALPFGVALPLRDALWNCRHRPNSSWPFSAFVLIGREDLFNFIDFDTDGHYGALDSNSRLVHESRAILQIQAAAAAASTEQVNSSDISLDRSFDAVEANNKDKKGDSGNKPAEITPSFVEAKGDGCELDAEIFRLRFLEDKRVNEVRRMLRSTDVIVMNPVEKSEQTNGVEFDMMAEQKLKLVGLLRKRLAAPVGRGAFTLRTFVPTDPTKPLPVPKINMTGKLFGQNGAKVSYTPTEHTHFQWGEFHNGVAAGLRIVAADNTREGGTDQILTRSWIVNHRPSDASGGATHAGMLLALGLGGYLPVLKKTDYIQYLVPRHELTAIGLMLGLSAGNVGCADEKITKMLCLHIRPFNEAGFSVPEFHVTVNVQTSAVLGLGLLHLGSCEHSLLEGLFAELGRKPKPGDAIDNREGLALAAGFSIGLLCLGHGASAFDAAERRRIDRLVLYANGGSLDELAGTEALFSGCGSGQNGGTGGRKMMMNMADRSSGMAAAMAAAVAESETSRVMEGGFVNTDVVSPGSLMALALIFMKTNDKRLADRIILPDSLYSLGRVRADHVYLRILARCLIMWDDIEPTEDWLRRVIPALLLPIKVEHHPDNIPFDSSFEASRNNINSDHAHDNVHDRMRHSHVFDLQGRINVSDFTYQHEVDVSGILQARAYAVSGACTAIALKYAGSCDSRAAAIICHACEAFEKALISPECARARGSMEFVYGTGMCSMALSLGIICAGSGDLQALKLLRRLRKRGGVPTESALRAQLMRDVRTHIGPDVRVDYTLMEDLIGPMGYALGVGRYGMHMAVHMAIGFLFLGAGCQTFGNSHLAVVGLLCSVLPPFPRDVTDNQYHLQALRHLYVLAVEPRCIDTRDVDTGKWCSVDMLMTLNNGTQRPIRAPCIVPQAKDIKHLTVTGHRYLHTRVVVNHPADGLGWFSTCRPQVVFVKRKAGHLPYNIDPKGGKGILSRCLNRPKPVIAAHTTHDNNSGNNSNAVLTAPAAARQRDEEKKYFKQVEHLVKAFSADPEILAFVKFFCCARRDDSDSGSDSDSEGSRSDADVEVDTDIPLVDRSTTTGIRTTNSNDVDDDSHDDASKRPQQKKRRHHAHSHPNHRFISSSDEVSTVGVNADYNKFSDHHHHQYDDDNNNVNNSNNGEKEKRYVEMLYDCLSNDKADAVKVYLEMERAVDDLSLTCSRSGAFPYVVDNLMLCETYINSSAYHHHQNHHDTKNDNDNDNDDKNNHRDVHHHLLRTDFVVGLLRKVRLQLHASTSTTLVRNALLHYVASHARVWPSDVSTVASKLAAALRLNAFPQVLHMRPLTEWIKKVGVEFPAHNAADLLWSSGAFTDSAFADVSDTAMELLLDAVANTTCA